jgi:hypothetical protein
MVKVTIILLLIFSCQSNDDKTEEIIAGINAWQDYATSADDALCGMMYWLRGEISADSLTILVARRDSCYQALKKILPAASGTADSISNPSQ